MFKNLNKIKKNIYSKQKKLNYLLKFKKKMYFKIRELIKKKSGQYIKSHKVFYKNKSIFSHHTNDARVKKKTKKNKLQSKNI